MISKEHGFSRDIRIVAVILPVAVFLMHTAHAQPVGTLARKYYELHPDVRVEALRTNTFTCDELHTAIGAVMDGKAVTMTLAGWSAESRPVYLYKAGNGPIRLLLWSQMHGDESTATMALADIINSFSRGNDGDILTRLTIYMIPMLNPDGAERFQRRNAQGLDINRDALSLQSPEANVLKRMRDSLAPMYGYNLHDQDPKNSVGLTPKPTAIGLLAPAFNEPKDDNDVRMRAKRLCSIFAQSMGEFIPERIAKYDDTFEPRAFGDNIQKWGTSTMLVESGGIPGDSLKMKLRRLNFTGLMCTFRAIAEGFIAQTAIEPYESLPFNGGSLCDIIVRNARIDAGERIPEVRADIGINIQRNFDTTSRVWSYKYAVVQFGDLRTMYGIDEYDGSSAVFRLSDVEPGKHVEISSFERLPELTRK